MVHNSLGRGNNRRRESSKHLVPLNRRTQEQSTEHTVHNSRLHLASTGGYYQHYSHTDMILSLVSSQGNKAIRPFHVPFGHTTLVGVGAPFISSSSFMLYAQRLQINTNIQKKSGCFRIWYLNITYHQRREFSRKNFCLCQLIRHLRS